MKTTVNLTLAQVLENRRNGDVQYLRKFTLYRLLEILQRVTETVALSHARKRACLNLAPQNIQIGTFGRIALVASRSRADAAGGPQSYAAPEMARGSQRKPGMPADIFALGAMLYEILCDRPPVLDEVARRARHQGVVPEPAAVRGGIDPDVAALCVNALHPNPARRPTASEFFDHIARYVRREMDWEVIRFGRGGRPLVASEWKVLRGKWNIRNGAWVAGADGENVLVWRVPVAGSFRFICDGWVRGSGELSLIGHGPSPEISCQTVNNLQLYQGYCFQFGAEFNTCTKLARNGDDVLAIPRLSVKPGRRYRLEIEYSEGWFRGFIDGRQVLAYQELFPGTGCQVGFYAYARNTFFQPIEVHRQNWALEVPATQVADEFFKQGYFEAALERYKQLALRFGGRFEGAEARLKVGACLARMNRWDEAHQAFKALSGSILEPYALAEDAMLEFRKDGDGSPRLGIERFQQLLKHFPSSQSAKSVLKVCDPMSSRPLKRGTPLEEDCALRVELYRMMSNVYENPILIQLHSNHAACRGLLQTGRYAEALEEVLQFKPRLCPGLQDRGGGRAAFIAAVLANGRDDLLPVNRSWERNDLPHCLSWTGLMLHCLVRGEKPASALRFALEKPSRIENYNAESTLQDQVLLYLALQQPGKAEKFIKKHVMPKIRPTNYRCAYAIGSALVDARCGKPLQAWINFLSRHSQTFLHANVSHVIAVLNARWALEEGRLDEAAHFLNGMPPPAEGFVFNDSLVLQLMLSSLGLLNAPIKEELHNTYERYIGGTELDLAHMFLGIKEPRPGKLWPHPLWRPEWRLWLALWLEARGNKAAARDIALSALDARYGLTHSQPALQALIERC